jgi:DNA adenine methylase
MSYQGGKKHLGKKIYIIIDLLEEYVMGESDSTTYIEPFVGFCGVMQNASSHRNNKCIGYDKNKNIIHMWNKLKKGWIPPDRCTKEKYEELKKTNICSAEKGFIGVACSYSGIFFGGGFRNELNYNGNKINTLEMTSRSLNKMVIKMNDVEFIYKDYRNLNPTNCLIYCDPPYANNTYNSEYFTEFDHEEFWNIMREWSKYNIVIVSEYKAPKDFKCIWSCEKNIKHGESNKKEKEKIFINESLYSTLDSRIKKIIKSI